MLQLHTLKVGDVVQLRDTQIGVIRHIYEHTVNMEFSDWGVDQKWFVDKIDYESPPLQCNIVKKAQVSKVFTACEVFEVLCSRVRELKVAYGCDLRDSVRTDYNIDSSVLEQPDMISGTRTRDDTFSRPHSSSLERTSDEDDARRRGEPPNDSDQSRSLSKSTSSAEGSGASGDNETQPSSSLDSDTVVSLLVGGYPQSVSVEPRKDGGHSGASVGDCCCAHDVDCDCAQQSLTPPADKCASSESKTRAEIEEGQKARAAMQSEFHVCFDRKSERISEMSDRATECMTEGMGDRLVDTVHPLKIHCRSPPSFHYCVHDPSTADMWPMHPTDFPSRSTYGDAHEHHGYVSHACSGYMCDCRSRAPPYPSQVCSARPPPRSPRTRPMKKTCGAPPPYPFLRVTADTIIHAPTITTALSLHTPCLTRTTSLSMPINDDVQHFFEDSQILERERPHAHSRPRHGGVYSAEHGYVSRAVQDKLFPPLPLLAAEHMEFMAERPASLPVESKVPASRRRKTARRRPKGTVPPPRMSYVCCRCGQRGHWMEDCEVPRVISSPPGDYVCHRCHCKGHWIEDCEQPWAPRISTVYNRPPPGYTCDRCGKGDHWIPDCPLNAHGRQPTPCVSISPFAFSQ